MIAGLPIALFMTLCVNSTLHDGPKVLCHEFQTSRYDTVMTCERERKTDVDTLLSILANSPNLVARKTYIISERCGLADPDDADHI